ncbi:MAG: hypothetical protein ACYTBJ_12030, partial [Planctomycetota bacterium]
MLTLRIKQAECALADGRLDEAFELVRAEDVRRHRQGQKLRGRLARAFAERGQNHLAAQRLQQAMTDCNKADKLAGNLPEIAELRAAICRTMEHRQHGHQKHAEKLAQAKEHIDNGWLSAGEQMLAEAAGNDSQADLLLQQAAAMRLKIDAVVTRGAGDLEAAIDIVVKAGITDAHDPKAAELTARIKSLACQRIVEDLGKGRLDPAESLLQRVTPLAPQAGDTKELAFAIVHCRKAARLISAGQPHGAARALRKVKTVLPKAAWLDAAINQAQQAAEAIDALCTGPLALDACETGQAGEDATVIEHGYARSFENDDNKPARAQRKATFEPPPDSRLPSTFVLQVDGVGSFLVLRDESVTVGPISSSLRPALALVADPHLPVATIERSDEDYFVRSQRPIYVNDRPVTEKLL